MPDGARHDRDFTESAWSWLGREDSTLLPFAPLLDLVAEYAGTRERVEAGFTVELGPGRRTALARVLSECSGPRFTCVGLPRFRTDLDRYRFEDVNTYLGSCQRASIDLVLSRYVLEESSYHPITLLRSPQFRKLVLQGKSDEVMRQLPSSPQYQAETLDKLAHSVRPGGLILAMVVDRKRAGCVFEARAISHFEIVTKQAIGSRRGRFVLRRK